MAVVILLSSHHPLTLLQAFNFFLFFSFIIPILKSLVVPVIWLALNGAIYSRIPPFFALNHIFFPGNEATLKTKQPIRFQGLFKETNQIARKWKTKSIILMISNWTCAARLFNFEITCMISTQIALHSVQLPLWIEPHLVL